MNLKNCKFKISDNNFQNQVTYNTLEEAKRDWNDNYARLNFDVYNENDVKVLSLTTARAVDEFCENHGVPNDNFWESMSLKDDFWEPISLGNMLKEKLKEKESNLPDTNLKTLAAQGKAKLSDVPPVALFALGAAMSDGASKYGRFNWRDTGTTSSVFYDAMMRHLTDWYNGENHADDSKISHLGHIMASCAILLDSELHGILNDDRDKRKPDSISRNPQNWKLTN